MIEFPPYEIDELVEPFEERRPFLALAIVLVLCLTLVIVGLFAGLLYREWMP